MIDVRLATEEDISGIARVHAQSWEQTYRGLMPDRVLDGISFESRLAQWRRWSLEGLYVAVDDGEVIGIAKGGKARDDLADGELYLLYVLAERHGAGIGRRLFDTVTVRLATAGHRTMVAWVLVGNPACRFYEHLGGRRAATKMENVGGTDLEHAAYVFDLPVLLA